MIINKKCSKLNNKKSILWQNSLGNKEWNKPINMLLIKNPKFLPNLCQNEKILSRKNFLV